MMLDIQIALERLALALDARSGHISLDAENFDKLKKEHNDRGSKDWGKDGYGLSYTACGPLRVYSADKETFPQISQEQWDATVKRTNTVPPND